MASSTIKKIGVEELDYVQLGEGYPSVNVSTQKGTTLGLLKAIHITFTLTSSSIPADSEVFKIESKMHPIANYAVVCGIDGNTNKIYHFYIDISGKFYCTETIPQTVSMRIIGTYI